MTKRMETNARKEQLLAAALRLAPKLGYAKLTRKQIAEEAGVSDTLLSLHFGTMAEFRRTLMRYAIKQGNTAVVAQGLADRNPYAKKAPAALKAAALQALA